MKNIIILTVMLLFAVSQGSLAQTALDTLKKELTIELGEILHKKAELQKLEYLTQWQAEYLMKYGSLDFRNKFGTLNPTGWMKAQNGDMTQFYDKEPIEARSNRATVDMRAEEIEIQQKILKKRANEIRTQLAALKKQQKEMQK